MYRESDRDIYEIYELFIKRVFIEKKDFLGDSDQVLLTKDNIDECKKRFIENYNEDKDSGFIEKAKAQFDGASEDVKKLFAHAIWFWGFSVNETKNCDLIYIENTKILERGFANAGLYHSTNKYFEVSFCLKLFDAVLNQDENTVENIKKYIEKICLCCAYSEKGEDYDNIKDTDIIKTYSTSVSMIHILLYLSCPENYERIVSNGHKQKIANCFDSLLEKNEKSFYLDKRLKCIRCRLSEIIGDANFDFYDNAKIYSLWNLCTSNENDDEFAGLKFKRNIVFYGPPGTSKTYSAKKLAESFIAREFLSNGDLSMAEYLNGEYEFGQYIHRLQLHANYGYENFIVGQTMNGGKIETVEGYFYKLCEVAAKDKDKPHILILDEINRVDLARLFGEAFSCIENRDDPVDLPYKKGDAFMQLSVPKNIYIIGTMNEIDFSLERLDFALRRRFLWYKHGYDPNTLFDMLTDIKDDEKTEFVKRATALNNSIRSIRELGDQYEIGHVFFAEIKDIVKSCSNEHLYTKYNNKFNNPKDPVIILWNISIRPMLEAYLDNIDVDVKKDILEELKGIYDGKNN